LAGELPPYPPIALPRQPKTRSKNGRKHPMLNLEKEVQGIAVYAEFKKTDSYMSTWIVQVIITPDGYTESGVLVPACLYRRTISTNAPKKQWRNSPLGRLKEEDITVPLEDNLKDLDMDRRMSFAVGWLDSLAEGGWSMVKEPILIETSKKDMTDIRDRSTPKKMLYRINQSRSALGFPELLQTPASV